ncbi:MAG: cupredoxin domain-containing protein [Anaerolineales bacterium]
MNLKKLIFYVVIIIGTLIIAFLPLQNTQGVKQDKVFEIKASQFQFTPGTIQVMPGDQITLSLTSLDVPHGIYLDGYNLKLEADPGQTNYLTFKADREGVFRFRCSVSCGSLHPFMIGKLQVGSNLLFLRGAGISLLVVLAVLGRSRL